MRHPPAGATAPLIALALALAGCPAEDPAPTCDPGCDPCQVCDTSGAEPVCVDACADGMTCNEDGLCDAPPVPTCDEPCGPCQVCDTSGEVPECVDTCADGMICNEDDLCDVPPEASCDLDCGPCQACDESSGTEQCVDTCADGMVCNEDGLCDAPPVEIPECDPACGPCQACDISRGEAQCVDLCGSGESCDAELDVCRPDPGLERFHGDFTALQGAFATGPDVTTACLTCHETAAEHFMETAHWRWLGETPQVNDHENDGTIGKMNLVNNFCIAVESNEARCSQCHAGYGFSDASFDFENAQNIDCLICHADLDTGYRKEPTTAGRPPVSLDLGVVARSVGRTTNDNCGACHFHAGGGDNVKKGDLGSALGGTPARHVDVHLHAGLTCSDCHAGSEHQIDGAGVHLPVTDGVRTSCTDCHWEPDGHALAGLSGGGTLDNHALDVACETCHIPAFSRQQPTKMDWDWSTAGNRVRETETTTLGSGAVVTSYHWQKGDFIWEQDVRPAYAWYDPTPDTANIERLTTLSNYPEGVGDSAENPVVLARPTATIDDDFALIFPFKVMTGRTPGHLVDRYMIVPKLFGPGSFWAGVPTAPNYTPEAVRALWTSSLNKGAVAAGQITTEGDIADADWGFPYTSMYMGIHHEVAPAEDALGCADCHGSPAFDFESLGYPCADPISDPTCSRHPMP